MSALAEIEELCLQEGRVMSRSACVEFRRAYVAYRAAYNALAELAIERGVCRYHLRPKMHQLGHLAFNYLPFNPRRFSNYLDEDFVFKTKRVAQSAHPLWMPAHVCMRYAIACCLRWWQGPL